MAIPSREERKRRNRWRKIRRDTVFLLCVALIVLLCVQCGQRQKEKKADDEDEIVIEEPEEEMQPEEPEEVFYMEYGTLTGTEIDTSDFIAPELKNNLDLVTFVKQAWDHQWGYVWGTYGEVLTESYFAEKLAQYPEDIGEYAEFIQENWVGRRTVDCIGLIKAYCWYDADTGVISYNSDNMPDCSTEALYAAAEEKGLIDTMPETPGVIVYEVGHIGVYIGNGYVIEARGTEIGVVKTKLEQRDFTHWLKCPYITYVA